MNAKRKALPYIDLRPRPIEWRERSPSLTVGPLMRAGRAFRAWREQARVALQVYACNRATPGDTTSACVAVLGVVLAVIASAFGLHMAFQP